MSSLLIMWLMEVIVGKHDWLKPNTKVRLTGYWVDWPSGTIMFVLERPQNGVLKLTPELKSSVSTHAPVLIVEPVIEE